MFELIALLLLSQQPVHLPMHDFTPGPALVAQGVASYYTVASSSRTTASGERMRDDQYTCAMRDGEFGDYYLVVADNGRSVVCRLNDRGPYAKGRVIDLSKAAIRQLHPSHGLVPVKVFHLGANPPPAAPN